MLPMLFTAGSRAMPVLGGRAIRRFTSTPSVTETAPSSFADHTHIFNESFTPVKAAAEHQENIAKYNAYLNTFIDLADPKQIQEQAESASQRWKSNQSKSPLDGTVMGYKMNLCTKELRTTCCSPMLDNFQAPYTATAIQLLEDAGVIMGGKVNMDEFGMGSYNTFTNVGPAKNPHNVLGKDTAALDQGEDRSPGGSSGGSAAAVASNMCFAALGSDTGGSVRLPASYCGVVGFKPSYGRISRWGLVAYASSLDTVGILAKSVDNTKLIYDTMAKEDPKDSTCLTSKQRQAIAEAIKVSPVSAEQNPQHPLSGVRIGIPQEFNIAELSPATRSRWRKGIQVLKDAGATVVPVSIPTTKLAVGAYFTLATAEASSNLQRYDGTRYGHQSNEVDEKEDLYSHTRSEGFGKEVKRRILLGTYVLTSGSFDNFFLRAQKIRQMIRDDFDAIFARPNAITGSIGSVVQSADIEETDAKVHALLSPCSVTTAPRLQDCVGDHIDPINAYMDDILTIPASLAGIPAMSVPFGICAEDGHPVGLQVMAQYGDEEMVFRVGRILEAKGKTPSLQ
ncbi:aspartyl-tRNA(Asn)/glutamyl-tRNA(Gln) amidotransferase subunit A [Entomortierella parvispora]|uniref:Glutamyl-tRNA(Gln) amidotransferase subunit A, mitochondrial n=1 Tax=Entomortierella parvispora TaxID=205924 RepID=A0A9P3HCJ6_9FUNG|nr:aspartyl-tRNA(Asn)/glutamyl-tRNA(Gln) amidotransferase subunit A [Entomortierella parvispora]